MSALSTRAVSSLAERLDALAFALLAILPLGMALINRSAQPLLIAATLATLAARGSAGEIGVVQRRVGEALRTPVGGLCLAFLAFGTVSIAWSHHQKVSLAALGEVLASAGAALLLHAALPRRIPRWVVKAWTIAIAIGCLTIVSELSTNMAFRTNLGIRNYTFIFKRSVTAILILGWPLAVALWVTGRRSIAVALALLFAVATYTAHSSATFLGLGVGLAVALLAAAAPRIGGAVLVGAMALGMLLAPFLGDAADRLLPPHAVERLDFAHARDRISIWQSFGEVVKRRPIGGAGFGTSSAMASEPVADEVPPERKVLLGAWHPHNGYLQVWAETGLVGALLVGAALVLVALSIRTMSIVRAAAAAAIMSSAAAVMLVGHGLWQGWWSAVLGIAAVWTARLPPEAEISPRRPTRRARP